MGLTTPTVKGPPKAGLFCWIASAGSYYVGKHNVVGVRGMVKSENVMTEFVSYNGTLECNCVLCNPLVDIDHTVFSANVRPSSLASVTLIVLNLHSVWTNWSLMIGGPECQCEGYCDGG